ncbi:MAG: DEAD/DEAH box helicase, partial [Chloroflexi bacterium]|nr:DEAD/DEAH box helicase [Chloroflexota bacterium]
MPQTLRDALNTVWELGYIPRTLPDEIPANLNPALLLRPYQEEALARLLYYLDGYPKRVRPSQVLFHMATGSGKTLVMAAAILYLYQQGYRDFVFFVNSTNIIDKTRDNFLNPLSSKYLFAETLKFGPQEVHIREVENFQAAYEDDIRILFTTIQGLHSRLNAPRENSLTYEDFAEHDVVLISDEAHHINALTKSGLNQDELFEMNTWEATVTRIFTARPGNVLLEFTATVELDHPAVAAKYADKILFQYDLKQFREDGYSKEVQVLQADLLPLERMLQAVVLSQYRRKVAEKHGLPLKPVILMKSRTIRESEQHETAFHEAIGDLDAPRLERLQRGSSGAVRRAFDYIAAQGIALEDLAAELRQDFDARRCLSVNSQSDSEAKQLLVNS